MLTISFIKENYYMFVYAVTLFISLATYRKYYDTALKYFPIIIAYTFFNEVLGFLVRNFDEISFFSNIKYSNYNDVIYNIYAIIFFCFFYYVYYKLIENKNFKKWIIISTIISLLSYSISTLYQNPLETNLFYALAISAWLLVSIIILYFVDKVQQKEDLFQLHNLMFWVSFSLVLFYSIFPIIYVIGYTDYDTWIAYDLKSVLRILIVVMYSLFIIGFLKGRKLAFR
ncbi:hypothetical protein [Maribacter hydrothermalis]|uniref:Uncharacterized protein n=1 Tax=Maribacter hydrothermalis TaxID=1836467 RepID=A0A1B7Z169_9FLAO|nr:hypothetical protein [Maribacter hydrothermalis]APQ18121.1 hypothetical protein BTR34_12645 [Maribacter hydrothermalis]OBR36467.1 hypothetical protein A9200_08540 [Maribacter hydrothermalis]